MKNRAGKVEKLQEPQDPGDGGNIPIHAAAMEGHLQVLQLVEARADTNAARDGKTALDFALDHGHFHVLKFLVESGANPNGDNFLVRSRSVTAWKQCDCSWRLE